MAANEQFRYAFFATSGTYEATLEFYSGAVGLRRAGYFDYGTIFQAGGGLVEVIDWDSKLSEGLRDHMLPGGASYEPPRGGWLLLEVPDVDAAHERLVEHGANVVRAPVDEPWGFRHLYALDPSGNTLSLFTQLGGSGAH